MLAATVAGANNGEASIGTKAMYFAFSSGGRWLLHDSLPALAPALEKVHSTPSADIIDTLRGARCAGEGRKGSLTWDPILGSR